jgi:hypothetical protein
MSHLVIHFMLLKPLLLLLLLLLLLIFHGLHIGSVSAEGVEGSGVELGLFYLTKQQPIYSFHLYSAEVVKNLTAEIEHLKSLPALDGVRALANDASSTLALARRLATAMANGNEWTQAIGLRPGVGV